MQRTMDKSGGVMARENTQWTPGNRDPSSSHKLRAMHSLRSISSGLDPGGLDAKARVMAVCRVVVWRDALLEGVAMRTRAARTTAVEDARAPRVEMRGANIIVCLLFVLVLPASG